MKTILIISGLILSSLCFAQGENNRIVSSYYEFEEGSHELLYGDNVVLRKQASRDSEALDTLSIGTELVILKRMQETIEVNGAQSNWYKVKYGKKTGFLPGGLIALDHKEIDNDQFLVVLAGDMENPVVRCRVLKMDGNYYGHESHINTPVFYIEVFDDRGVDSIENMLCVNLFAEACGVDGGQIYLFNDGSRLIEAIQLSSVSDAGVFWFNEKLTFPEDESGYPGAILYEREVGEPVNEEMFWTRSVTHTLVLQWQNGQFTPDKKEMEFD